MTRRLVANKGSEPWPGDVIWEEDQGDQVPAGSNEAKKLTAKISEL